MSGQSRQLGQMQVAYSFWEEQMHLRFDKGVSMPNFAPLAVCLMLAARLLDFR